MKYYLLLLISLFFSSCTNYENKETYKIKKGETFEIYYSSNSTSYYKINNKEKLKKIKLVEHKKLDNFNSKCEGCSSHYSFKFIGLIKGEETIFLSENIIRLEEGNTTTKYKVIIE